MENKTGPRPAWWRRQGSYKWLSAPLFLVVVGALLSVFLPKVFDGSEDDAKRSEIQSLARDMTEASADVRAAALEFAGVVAKEDGDPQTRFNTGLKNWRSAAETISTRLTAAGAPRLSTRWQEYSGIVEDLYYLSGTAIEQRCRRTQNVKNFILRQSGRDLACWNSEPTDEQQKHDCLSARENPPWNALAACDADNLEQYSYARGSAFVNAYESVNKLVRDRGLELSNELLRD
jgi:hypothetical protein